MPEILTHKTVERVLRSAERLEITDAKATGLILRGKTSGVTWAFRSNKSKGENTRRTLGAYPAMSLAQARKIAQAANDRLRSGLGIDERWIAEQRVAIGVQDEVPDALPLGRIRARTWLYEEAVEAYLTKIGPSRKPATIRNYGQKLTHPALKAAFWGVPVCDITRRQASKVVEEVAVSHSTTAEDMVGMLGRFWAWMAADGQAAESGVQESTMVGLRRPDRPRDRIRGAHIKNPDMAVLGKIVVACRSGILHPSTARALELLILTAQRRETIASAWLSEIDTQGSKPIWKISATRMKMNGAHWLPLSPRALQIMQEAAIDAAGEGSEFAFPQARPSRLGAEVTHVHPDTLSHYMSYIGDTTPHRVRIAFTSSCGLETAEAALVLDHMEGRRQVTEIHYDLNPKIGRKREFLERWEAALQPHIDAAQRDFDPAVVLAEIRRRKKDAQKGRRKLLKDRITESVQRRMAAHDAEQAAHEKDKRVLDEALHALQAGTMSIEEFRHRLRLDA